MKKSILQTRLRDMGLLVLLVLALALPGLTNIPVIDRDEARYAQASVQMLETGDYVNIRFQDRARNKKPAGSYWLQAGSVKLFSDVEKREIWPHRIPSVLGALLAILATYWGGVRMLGREAAMIGCTLLGISMIFVFESHIAKTDALLCGFSALSLASMAHLRNGGGRKSAILFWLALGCAVIIKGPILPLLLILCFISLMAWERNLNWAKPLGYWVGPLLFLAITMPWMILIWRETNGAFFTDAIGGDLTPKLKGGQETHGGPPGYYSVLTWATFWPSCLFLLPGLAFALRAARNKQTANSPVSKTARLLYCWSVPFFIVFEVVPTKLPHYTLPIYPALALMAAAAVVTLTKVDEFPVLRKFNAVIFALVSTLLVAALLFGESFYGNYPTWTFVILGFALIICLAAAIRLWSGHGRSAFILIVIAALAVNIPTYQFTLPSLNSLLVSKNVEMALNTAEIETPMSDNIVLISPQFTEPSLVHALGTSIRLGQPEKRLEEKLLETGSIVLLDRANTETESFETAYRQKLKQGDYCLSKIGHVEGFNYSKGDEVSLELLEVVVCPQDEEILSAPNSSESEPPGAPHDG